MEYEKKQADKVEFKTADGDRMWRKADGDSIEIHVADDIVKCDGDFEVRINLLTADSVLMTVDASGSLAIPPDTFEFREDPKMEVKLEAKGLE